MAELLAQSNAAATSADVTLADAASATVSLKSDVDNGIPERAFAVIEFKGSDSNYYHHTSLTKTSSIARILGPCTFRVRKAALADIAAGASNEWNPATETSFGVDKV